MIVGLSQAQTRLVVKSRGPGFYDVTREMATWLASQGASRGLLTAFVCHTSASLVIQENADPDVTRDLSTALDNVAPRTARYRHASEGPDDMPAHIKAMLTATSIAIPVSDGKAVLGTWQALYLIEHRDAPHTREIVLHFIGEIAGK